MINRNVVRSAVHDKMMNKTLTIIAEECFFGALPYNFNDLTEDEKLGLHGYVSQAIEHLGGASKLLKKAVEATVNDSAKNNYMKSMLQICNEAATEVAKRVADSEVTAESKFDETVNAANFTEEEFKKFETNADKLKVEDVTKIISEKVIETIKGEQEAIANEEALNEEIKAVIADSSEDPEATVESFYKTALDANNPRHYVSLLSKLTDVAIETVCLLYPNDIGKNISVDTISDITHLYSLNTYKCELSAEESIQRMLNIDATILNDNEFRGSTVELFTKEAFESAMVNASTVLTFMETMKTLNLVSPTKEDISKFINTQRTPASYGKFALESFMGKWQQIFAAVESTIRGCKTVDELSDYKSYFSKLETDVTSIGIASEGFIECKDKMCETIKATKDKIDDKIVSLLKTKPEMSASDKVRFDEDVAKLNKFYANYRHKICDQYGILCDTAQKDNQTVELFIADNKGMPLSSTFITLNNAATEEYVRDVFNNSKLKGDEKKTYYRTKSGKKVEM